MRFNSAAKCLFAMTIAGACAMGAVAFSLSAYGDLMKAIKR